MPSIKITKKNKEDKNNDVPTSPVNAETLTGNLQIDIETFKKYFSFLKIKTLSSAQYS